MHPSTAVADAAFASFASHYDAYTHHPAYAGWVAGIAELALRHGAPGRRLLDLACGTGSSIAPVLALGFEVTGCDCVPAMLARARVKVGDRARLVHADVRALPRLGAFDVATCLNDVANYLPATADVGALLRGAARSLAPGGVLVLDVNTLLTFRTTFATTHVREREGACFVWRGTATPAFAEGDVARAHIDAFVRDGDGDGDGDGARWTRATSVHEQRHHPLLAVRRLVAEAGLELVAVLGQFEDGTRDDHVDEAAHHKAVLVARRPASEREGV